MTKENQKESTENKKTHEIYTHVSTKNIQKIISPFDYL
jgi:hypothetical protein